MATCEKLRDYCSPLPSSPLHCWWAIAVDPQTVSGYKKHFATNILQLFFFICLCVWPGRRQSCSQCCIHIQAHKSRVVAHFACISVSCVIFRANFSFEHHFPTPLQRKTFSSLHLSLEYMSVIRLILFLHFFSTFLPCFPSISAALCGCCAGGSSPLGELYFS